MAEAQNPIPEQPGFDFDGINKVLGNMNLNSLGPLLNNINLSSLAPLLNNINLTQLLPLVPSVLKMFGNGSSFNLNPSSILNPRIPMGGVQSSPGLVGQYEPFIVPPHLQGDPRFVVLGAIRPFLPQDKSLLIDQVMKYLMLFLTISAVLPKTLYKPPVAAPVTPSPAIKVAPNESVNT